LKDRAVFVHRFGSARAVEMSVTSLFENEEEMPDWVGVIKLPKEKKQILVSNDREHLLLFVERGCLQFDGTLSRVKRSAPDYIIIGFESPEFELTNTIDVVVAAKKILDGLDLPAFVKSDGKSGLHVYIPLDGKSSFESAKECAEYLCRLVRLKVPHLVAVEGIDDKTYGKVLVTYLMNEEGQGVVVPYSLVAGDAPLVAAPLLWEEVQEGLRLEEYNHQAILKRLKEVGDPFQNLTRNKVNADELVERLDENYGFLF
jgi:bifunctional non-homologous end joining protein LigD